MKKKINAINLHESQYDPLYPSFDPRKFWERAYQRNKDSSDQLKIAINNFNLLPFVEIFKIFSFDEFIKKYF
jgi:hypothetical protein